MHPISYFQAIVLGLLQGVSELFPISSLGHAVIAPRLFGWNIHQNDTFFLTFLVAVHLATALVLLGFFWRDWVRIVRGFGRSVRDRRIGDAVRAPRLHFEDDVVYVEPGIDTSAFEQGGRTIGRFRATNLFFGGVQAVERDREGRFWGGGDPRRGGAAIVVEG